MFEDKILLVALSRGSLKAFDALYRKYAHKVERFAAALLLNGGFGKADVEDLVQEIFMKLWQKRDSLAGSVDCFDAYLFRMTKNAVLNVLSRQRTVHDALEAYVDVADRDDVVANAIASDTRDTVDRTVEDMPDERKIVFMMSRIEGMANKEIAGELGISLKTVEYHINRALKDIKKNLS